MDATDAEELRERVRKLREEIARIRIANAFYMRSRFHSAKELDANNQRTLRLDQIMTELSDLLRKRAIQ